MPKVLNALPNKAVIACENAPAYNAFSMYASLDGLPLGADLRKNIKVQTESDGFEMALDPSPLVTFTAEQTQALINSLWRLGWRPSPDVVAPAAG